MKPLILKSIIAAGIFAGALAQPASALTTDYCREYNSNVKVGNAREAAYGTACYQPDGSWKIGQTEEQEIEVAHYSPQPVYVNQVRYITPGYYYEPRPVFSLSFGNSWYSHRPHYYHDNRRYRHWDKGHHPRKPARAYIHDRGRGRH